MFVVLLKIEYTYIFLWNYYLKRGFSLNMEGIGIGEKNLAVLPYGWLGYIYISWGKRLILKEEKKILLG